MSDGAINDICWAVLLIAVVISITTCGIKANEYKHEIQLKKLECVEKTK